MHRKQRGKPTSLSLTHSHTSPHEIGRSSPSLAESSPGIGHKIPRHFLFHLPLRKSANPGAWRGTNPRVVPSGACATAKSFNYAERDTEADWRHLGRLSFLHITFSPTFPTLPFPSPPRARRLSLYSPASPSFYTKNEALLPFCFEKSRQRRNRKHIQHSQTCAAGKAVDLIDPARPGRAARGPRVDARAHLSIRQYGLPDA